ncbi:hypothetical protein DFH07DRAFT_953026 [Mycena maculata]|uniref:Uncharacterized protein n=1 Tax=Mycena maculata TaxID=230809 RepID=A0AAD7JXS2_9AGAR|nr:hypothetical protein DFH07DRAFT_953026 [Mycena maculata]
MAKSHPVSYLCGQSLLCLHQAVVRTRLEVPGLPCIHEARTNPSDAEKHSLAAAYPEWDDKSRVEYKWDSLSFPKMAEIVVVESD